MKTKIYPIVYPNSLRRYRKEAGLRQLDVARLIGLEGSTERLSKWENGAADPNIDNLFRLLALYKTTPQELYPEKWQANQCLESGKYAQAIADSKKEGDTAGVTGTPKGFILKNGKIVATIDGAESWTTVKPKIDSALR